MFKVIKDTSKDVVLGRKSNEKMKDSGTKNKI